MKQIYILTLLFFTVLSITKTNAQTVWTGTTTTFTKSDFADWTLEANQDRITDNVWITRQNKQSIFNIKVETSNNEDGDNDACTGPTPADTEWAYGTTANYATLTYEPFGTFSGCDFQNFVVNQNIVLHLITDDIYIDLKFTFWSKGGGSGTGGGGGFAYERSTDQTLSAQNFELDNKITLFPNPSSDFIRISGVNEKENYSIYNVIGSEINKGIISKDKKIDIQNLKNGLYFLKLENANTFKFIKE